MDQLHQIIQWPQDRAGLTSVHCSEVEMNETGQVN